MGIKKGEFEAETLWTVHYTNLAKSEAGTFFELTGIPKKIDWLPQTQEQEYFHAVENPANRYINVIFNKKNSWHKTVIILSGKFCIQREVLSKA